MSSWWDYVNHVAGGDNTEIAFRLRLSPTSIWRWQTKTPRPQNVAAFARAYNRPVLEAFIAAEYLTADDAEQTVVVERTAAELTNEELLAELAQRVRNAKALQEAGGQVDAPPLSHGFLDRIAKDVIPDDDLQMLHARIDEGLAAELAETDGLSMAEARQAVSAAMKAKGAPEAGKEPARRGRAGSAGGRDRS